MNKIDKNQRNITWSFAVRFRECRRCCELSGRHLLCAPGLDAVAAAEAVEGSRRRDDPVRWRVTHERPYRWAAASTALDPCSWAWIPVAAGIDPPMEMILGPDRDHHWRLDWRLWRHCGGYWPVCVPLARRWPPVLLRLPVSRSAAADFEVVEWCRGY